MNSLPPNHWNESDFAELEQIIADAKGYVVPSADLRPRVIDSVREIDVQHVHLAKLRNLIICAVLLWMIVMAVFFVLSSKRKQFTSPTSSEVEQKSIEYATQNGYSKDWGMVDVFRELRGGNAPNTSP